MTTVRPIRDPHDVLDEIRYLAGARLNLYAEVRHQAALKVERELRRLVAHAPQETIAAARSGDLKHWVPAAWLDSRLSTSQQS